MKNRIVFFIFNIIIYTSSAQSTFEKIISNQFDQKPFGLELLGENILIGVNNLIDEKEGTYELILLSNSGTFIKNMKIDTSDQIHGENILIDSDSSFIVMGEKIYNNGVEHMWLARYDLHLNKILEIEYDFPNYFIYQIHTVKNEHGFFNFGFGRKDDLFRLFILDIDGNGNIIHSDDHFTEQQGWATGLFYDHAASLYYLLAFGGFGLHTAGQVCKLDTNYIIDTVFPTPYDLNYQYTMMNAPDSSFYLGGCTYSLNGIDIQRDYAILNIDSEFYVKNIFENGDIETDDYSGFYKTFDYNDPNNIFFCATYNFIVDFNFTYYQEVDNKFTICKLDEKLELQWQKYYGEDAYYNLYYSKATNDGGVIILGTKYDEAFPRNRRDIYILKVDSLGNYFPSTIQQEVLSNDFKIYPNPGRDYLNIETPENFKYGMTEIFDLSGRVVARIQLQNTTTQISTEHLYQGLYLIKITSKNGSVLTKKWMKE